mmetsp:Transcript_15910/g.43979  ORF Transcript_15910/g.43979 Transcript_15910/m.43979 type:complete len:152 (-) Transcript_15910:487-942(-)|eukprot:CAMPEP_0198116704 /NCGR_PEP_ID=MMETSP1442-20131203/14119_1 /TAXON_ID= /ORGANISM="Craspedostauros australis, Strain CCMP3328" /LENGTH=151 /DNA_ID=CAMNT_0043774593 /DNA_START=191 /DNA_END=646 /DNA_ORIENTATION=+
MATRKSCEALKKTKDAIVGIKRKLRPIVERLNDDTADQPSISPGMRAQAQATVALSLGMMRFMAARLRGLDQGRKPDDALRQDLNKMRKLLAEIKSKNEKQAMEDAAAKRAAAATTTTSTATSNVEADAASDEPDRKKRRVSPKRSKRGKR